MTLSSLSKLEKLDYQNKAVDLIKNFEGASATFYVNSPSDIHPTIGYGFNIDAFSYQEIVAGFKFVLKNLSVEQKKGLELIKIYKSGGNIKIDGKLVKFDYAIFKALIEGKAGAESQQRALNSISLSVDQQRDLLKEVLFNNNKIFSKSFDEKLTTQLGKSGAIETSQERVALLSAFYNTHSLIGSGIISAIADDSRSALWYELRYNHLDQNNSRRFSESNKIKIVPDSHTVDDSIKKLDYLFNESNQKGKNIYEDMIYKDHHYKFSDKSGIPLDKQFVAKAAPLLKEIAKEYNFEETLHFLQSGGEAVDSLQSKQAYGQNGKLLPVSNNALFGQGGNDVLTGSKGDDLLVGGQGADTMKGGRGNDTYFVDDQGDKIIEEIDSGSDTLVLQTAGVFDFKNIESLVLDGPVAGAVKVNVNEISHIKLTDANDRITVVINKIQPVPIEIETGAGSDVVTIALSKGVDPSQVHNGSGVTESFVFSDFSGGDRVNLSAFHIKSIVTSNIQLSSETGYYLLAPGGTITIDTEAPLYGSYYNNTSDWWIAQLGNSTPWGPSMHGNLNAASFIV